MTEIKRSSRLKALEVEYGELRKRQPVRTSEPENTGRSIEAFVELTTAVAEDYAPSEYIKSAPIK